MITGGTSTGEAELDVTSLGTLPGIIDVLGRGVNDLNVGVNPVLGAEVEHLLGLGHAAGGRPRNGLASEAEQSGKDVCGFLWDSDGDELVVGYQEHALAVHVVVGGHGVQDEIEVVCACFVRAHHEVVGLQPLQRSPGRSPPCSRRRRAGPP